MTQQELFPTKEPNWWRRITIGLLIFWALLIGWLTEVWADQSAEEKLGIGRRIVAPLSYCTTEEAIRKVAEIAVKFEREQVIQYMGSVNVCSVSGPNEYIIFEPKEALDVIQPLNKEHDAFIVRLVIVGVVNEVGYPIIYPQEAWVAVYALAARDKDGQAS